MKLQTFLILGAVLTSGLSLTVQVRKKRASSLSESLRNVMELIKILPVGMHFLRYISNEEWILQFEASDPDHKKFLTVYTDLFRATVLDGASPTEAQLADIAKRMSELFRTNYILSREKGNCLSNEAIVALKGIVTSNPIKESGNNFAELIANYFPKRESKFCSNVTKQLKYIEDNWRTLTNDPTFGSEGDRSMEKLQDFIRDFVWDDYYRLRRSEKYALYSIKNFAGFIEVLKDPSSFENLTSLYKGLARRKYMEAWAIIAREAFKCALQPLSYEDQKNFYEDAIKLLHWARQHFVDKTKMKVEIREFPTDLTLDSIFDKVEAAYKLEENRENLGKCLLSEEDRRLFQEVMELNTDLLTEDKIDELKSKNEKVYAIVSLVNNATRATRNRETVGSEAGTFLKQLETTPHNLLWMAQSFAPHPETVEKYKEEKSRMTRKFNELPASAKEELVEAYPFRTFFILVSLK